MVRKYLATFLLFLATSPMVFAASETMTETQNATTTETATSADSQNDTTTASGIAQAPTGLSATGVTTNSIILHWDTIPEATEYVVYSSGEVIATPLHNFTRISGLSSNTTYQLSVAGSNDAGDGPESNTLSITTLAPAATTGTGSTGTGGGNIGTISVSGREKDVIGEARSWTERSKWLELISDFASRFNDKLFGGGGSAQEIGEKWAWNLLITVARDLKNFFTILAIIFLVIVVLVFLMWQKGEEDTKKLKNAIIYTAYGILLMQSSYIIINVLFNKDVGAGGAASGIDFINAVIFPIIRLIEVLASFAFLAMAFVAFFSMVASNGDAKAREGGIKTISGAIIGFILIKISGVLVRTVYGDINCPTVIMGQCQGDIFTKPNLSETIKVFAKIINYANGFIGIITVLLIIYTGWMILFRGEEGMKKGKSMIKWIVIGLLLLVTSYIIFNFFLMKDIAS